MWFGPAVNKKYTICKKNNFKYLFDRINNCDSLKNVSTYKCKRNILNKCL